MPVSFRSLLWLLAIFSAAVARRANAAEPISRLTAPREVSAGQDASFEATLPPETTGAVKFTLQSYVGETVWTASARVESGRASVALPAAEVAELAKGSYVVVATLDGNAESPRYAPIRLRGRVFHNPDGVPGNIQPGDEIVLTDLARLEPADAIRPTSARGKWWRRAYREPGSDEVQSLVCVEEEDPDDPAACLAGQLRLPLGLDGWYEIWIRTYRHAEGGGIDVRLSGEKYFLHADPRQIDRLPQYRRPPDGALVDVRYRAADVTGQHLVFQQPYGTFESEHKRSNASLAGVRLVKLSEEQAVTAPRAHKSPKVIGYDDDGFSYFWRWGVRDRACIARLLEPLRDQSADFFNIELGGLGGITIPTPYTGMYQMTGHDRDGDFRANEFFRWCFENNVNLVDVLAQRAHEVGLRLFVSLMAERSFSRDKTISEHPEWRIRRGPGTWDYALPEVQDYQVEKIAWICAHHEIDGFILDFTRYGHFFNRDEPAKFEHMNAFLRKLRAAFDNLNAAKERKVLLCASFGDRSWHLKHWGTGKLDDQGLDVRTWLGESLLDAIMPEGPTALDFVAMAKDLHSRTQVWPRKVQGATFDEHKFVRDDEGPKELENGAKHWFDRGAAGIFFFNHEPWTTLGRIGFDDELALRAKVDDVHGYREGLVIAFAAWYPSIEERNRQREVFKPLCFATDSPKQIEGTLAVPLENTFDRPVTAAVDWVYPNEKGDNAENLQNTLSLSPPRQEIDVAAGARAKVEFRVSGTASGHAGLPRARIVLSTQDGAALRHSLPLRAVPEMACRRIATPPTIDGRLDDPAWVAAGGVAPRRLLVAGRPGDPSPTVKMALAHDDENLYVAYDYMGDVTRLPGSAPVRDSAEINRMNHVALLVDPEGREEEYREFRVTPSGAQADAQIRYDPLLGHFARNAGWNADWTPKAAIRDGGYSIEMAIPWKALARPKAGDVWRINLVATSTGAGGELTTASWSSSETAAHLPRHEGTLFGVMRFQ